MRLKMRSNEFGQESELITRFEVYLQFSNGHTLDTKLRRNLR